MRTGWIDLVDKVGGGAFCVDPETLRVTFASSGVAALSGHPVERWLAEPPILLEILHADDRDAALGAIREAKGPEPRVCEHRLRTADGRILVCRTAAQKRPDEDSAEVMAVIHDITAERQANEQRREAQARLLALVENLPFDFWVCDNNGRYVMQNITSKKSWGDNIGLRPEDLDAIDAKIRAHWVETHKTALEGTVVRGEFKFYRGNKPMTFFNIIAPIRDGAEIRGLLGINIDVTDLREAERERDRLFVREQRARALAQIVERRNQLLVEELSLSLEELQRTQAALVQRERLAALGELASVIAHEVRNPLGAIFNSLGALRRKVSFEGEAAILFEILDEEAKRLNRIVVDLLDWVRPLQPMLHPASLAPIAEGALRAAVRGAKESSPHVDIALSIEPDLPPVLVDEQLLHLALVNIFSNALQAMPRGGRLTVVVRQVSLDDQLWAEVSATDTGAGIPPEVVSRIFEPFFTTRASGTGLGLAVVKRIIESLGGEIEAESPPNEGATFRVRLRPAPDPI